MRVINLDVLKKDYCEDTCGERKCIDAMDKCMFMEFIDDQPIIEHNEWIPCSERLPLDSGWYMTSCVDNDGYEFVKICSFHKSIDEEFSFFDAFSNVIAWRPLPQPYKEETK